MFDLNANVREISGYSLDQINAMLVNTGLIGLGQAFYDAEHKYMIRADFLIAHAAEESAWGTSYLAQRNNLYGLNAPDNNPNAAWDFPSKAACIDFYGDFLSFAYLDTPNGSIVRKLGQYNYSQGMYNQANGSTIHDIFIKYSSSHDGEANTIASIMNELATRAGGQALPSHTPTVNASDVYTIKSGDTLSAIAAHFGISDYTVLYNYNGNKSVIGLDPNTIHPGQVLHIPQENQNTSAPQAPSPQFRTVIVERWPSQLSTLSGIAQAKLGNGGRWPEIQHLNGISDPSRIYPGQTLKLPN